MKPNALTIEPAICAKCDHCIKGLTAYLYGGYLCDARMEVLIDCVTGKRTLVLQRCSQENPEGFCSYFTPRRSWFARTFGTKGA